MDDKTDIDKFEFYSELFEKFEKMNVNKESENFLVTTESWIAQLGVRNIN